MKTTAIRAVALSTLCILTVISCRKALTEEQTRPAVITRTIEVEAGTIGSDETPGVKSVYESGVGVHLTNNEYMSVYYSAAGEGEAINEMTHTVGTPDGSGKWSFSHNAISDATAYNYSFLLPYTSKNETPSSKKQFKFRLCNVQHPTASSFDPNADFLLGQTRFGVSQADAVSGVKFKRIFAPVKLEISDGAGILGDEKVYAVSFSLSQTPTKTAALAGLVYLTPGTSDYDNAYSYNFATDQNSTDATTKKAMNNFSNAVSALIAGGVEKSEGAYHIWYIMSPLEIGAGTKVTVCVTAATKTVTREATLTAATAILRDRINVIPFDISGDGYSVESSGHCNFAAVTGLKNQNLAMTDGTTPLTPSYSSMRYDTPPSAYPQSLMLNTNGSKDSWILVKPGDGKKLAKVRIYTNYLIGFGYSPLMLKDGETELGSKIISWGNVAGTAGYADFTVPSESAASENLSIYAPTGVRHWFSGITLFYAD